MNGVTESLKFTSQGHDEKKTEIFLKLRELDIEIEHLKGCYDYLSLDCDQRMENIELLMESKV